MNPEHKKMYQLAFNKTVENYTKLINYTELYVNVWAISYGGKCHFCYINDLLTGKCSDCPLFKCADDITRQELTSTLNSIYNEQNNLEEVKQAAKNRLEWIKQKAIDGGFEI